MITVYHTNFETKLPYELWELYLKKLPVDKQHHILRYKRWQDAHASLFSYLLINEAFKKNTSIDFDFSQIKLTDFGRPYLNENIDFNISHSGKHVVCAISDNGKVGIDIEHIQPIDISDFKKFITELEWNQIHESPNLLNSFYKLWSSKEAVMKADGRGMKIPLKEIHLDGDIAKIENKAWYLNSIDLDPNYSLCLASESENEKIEFVEINFSK